MRYFSSLLLVLCCLSRAYGQYGTSSVIAGGGGGCFDTMCYCYDSYSGDGGAATAYGACFNGIGLVVVDRSGNILLTDAGNHRIRKVSASTGIVTTIAGNGTTGFSGDGGPATTARISDVAAICTDWLGNCYFVDWNNQRIRRIHGTTGVITTVAGNGSGFSGDGGPATSAGIGDVRGVFVDSANNILFTDFSGRIRKVSAGTGIVNTIAGGATAGFSGDGGPATSAALNNPTDIVADRNGTVYFIDNGNSRIRKISASGTISTFAGGGGSYGIDGCPATAVSISASNLGIDSAGNIFVFEPGSWAVRKISAATGIINTIIGTAGWGWGANGMFVDSSGNIYGGTGWASCGDESKAFKVTGAWSRINTFSVKDSVSSTPCTLPGILKWGMRGTINDTVATTDSVDATISIVDALDHGIYSRTYRVPYWYTSGSYGFGSTVCNLDSFVFSAPGIYRTSLEITTMGYGDSYHFPPDTVGANCGSAITGITSAYVWDTLVSPTCYLPGVVNYAVYGTVSGTATTADSMYVHIEFGDGTYADQRVPFSISSGGTYVYCDSISHTFTSTPSAGVYIRIRTSSGYFTTEPEVPSVAVQDCHGGGVYTNLYDSAPHDAYSYDRSVCTVPFTNNYGFDGSVSDSAMLSPTATKHIYFGDGTDTSVTVPIYNDGRGHFSYSGSFSHTYLIPGSYDEFLVDSAGIYTYSYHGGWALGSRLFLGSSCSPLLGSFYIDSNANCVRDTGEVGLSYWPFALINSSRGTTSYGWCDENGNYSLNVFAGDTFTLVSNPFGTAGGGGTAGGSLTPSCPSSGTYTFTTSAGSSDTQSFAFTCTAPTIMDMSISGWGAHFVPGQVGYIAIWSSNPWGFMCDTLNSTVTLIIDSNLSYSGMWTGPAPTSISGDTLRWNFSTSGSLFDFSANVKVTTDTTATIFDTVRNQLYVSPSTITDPDLTNNAYVWRQPVVSSWDPNEKAVSPMGYGPEGYVPNGTPLSYMIHFQNTGSAPAYNITVADTISANLDISTLQVISSSSPVLVYQFGNVIKFRFNDINLPDSTSDPTGSIGYISYNIIPHDSLAPGTQITNKAGIYFDYNPAVYTNATLNTIEDTVGLVYGADTVCTGASTMLSNHVSGGVWTASNSHATVDASGVVTGVTPGLDTITYTIYENQRAHKVIYVKATPGIGTITGSSSVCSGGTITLGTTISGGAWTSSGTGLTTVSSSGAVTGVSPGIDTVYYTVANSCGTGTAPFAISVVVTPVSGTISGPSSVCEVASITLTSTVSGGAWSVSNASATVSGGLVTGVSSGSDSILYTVTNACGSAVSSTIITINPLPVAGTISGSSSVCTGATTTLSSTITGGTWSLSSSALATVSSGGIVTGVTSGTDTVFYAVTNGCGTSRTFSVITITTVPSPATFAGSGSICPGTSTTLTPSVSGGTWGIAGGSVATVSSGVVTGVSSGTDTVLYTVTNTCGATVSMRIITVNSMPVAGTLTSAFSVCAGATTAISASISGGSWSSSSTTIATVSGGIVGGVSAGIAIISYTVTNSCGSAVTTDSILVIALPSAGTVSVGGTICVGGSVTLSSTVSGGMWAASNSFAVVSGGVVTGAHAGIDTIYYTVSNSCGSSTVSTIFHINPLPVAGAVSGSSSFCVGSSITLTADSTGGSWLSSNPSLATVAAGSVSGVGAGVDTIWYILTNSCGSDTTFVPISVLTVPSSGSLSGASNLCIGDSLTLTPTVPGGTWSASSSVATVSGGIVIGVTTGSVTITYTVANICGTAYTTQTITVNPLPNPGTITGIDTICEGTTTTMTDPATGGSWSSSNTAVATIAATGLVTGVAAGSASISYTATNACGTQSATSPLHVNALADCPTEIKIIGNVTNGDLTILPNPNTGIFGIELPTHNSDVLISITDAAGKTVKTLNITNAHQLQIPMDMTNVAAGVYMVRVETDGRVWRKKIVVM